MPKAQVFPRPQGMSAQEGASIPVNYLTAWQLMVVMGGLKPNETVLIHSAGGGVGIAATQIAKHIGAKVIGTASAAKHGELRAFGVDHLIDYRTEDFDARARQITGGRGVELILDAIGGDLLKKGYRLRADRQARDVWGFVGGNEQDGRDVRHVVHAREHALASVQSPVPIERKQRSFGVNLGHMWDEVDRMRGLARSADEPVGAWRD